MFTIVKPQSGNVLFLILIAVALFAALSYAVTSSSRSGDGGSITKDKAKLVASEIRGYAAEIRRGIDRVRIINRCAISQISFQHDALIDSPANYNNTSSPTDNSCHIFHPNGGGVAPRSSISNQDLFHKDDSDLRNVYDFANRGRIKNVGTDGGGEIIMGIGLKLDDNGLFLCEEFNRVAIGTKDAPAFNWFNYTSSTAYNGTLIADQFRGNASPHDVFSGKYQGCHQHTTGNTYHIFIVILAT